MSSSGRKCAGPGEDRRDLVPQQSVASRASGVKAGSSDTPAPGQQRHLEDEEAVEVGHRRGGQQHVAGADLQRSDRRCRIAEELPVRDGYALRLGGGARGMQQHVARRRRPSPRTRRRRRPPRAGTSRRSRRRAGRCRRAMDRLRARRLGGDQPLAQVESGNGGEWRLLLEARQPDEAARAAVAQQASRVPRDDTACGASARSRQGRRPRAARLRRAGCWATARR